MSNVRIYHVTATNGAIGLVKATNQAQALRHVARQVFTIKPATALEVADRMADGIKVEDATKEPTDLVEESGS